MQESSESLSREGLFFTFIDQRQIAHGTFSRFGTLTSQAKRKICIWGAATGLVNHSHMKEPHMLSTSSTRCIGVALAGAMGLAMIGEATAAPINTISQPGYYNGGRSHYGYNRHYGRRYYGGSNVGAALGLGILGLGLGALAGNGGYGGDYYDGGYAPVYSGGYGYDYGYQPRYYGGYGYQPRYYGGYGYRHHYHRGYGYRYGY